jgi:hypothetical protein
VSALALKLVSVLAKGNVLGTAAAVAVAVAVVVVVAVAVTRLAFNMLPSSVVVVLGKAALVASLLPSGAISNSFFLLIAWAWCCASFNRGGTAAAVAVEVVVEA